MVVVYYDKVPVDQLVNMRNHIAQVTDDKVLFIPKDFDILLDCSVSQLQAVKNMIEAAIKAKTDNN